LAPGEKSAVHWFRNYLVIITQDGGKPGSLGRLVDADDSSKHILSIFDLQNKLIAYTAPIRAVKALVSALRLLGFSVISILARSAKEVCFHKK
jgi:hypothetical protein